MTAIVDNRIRTNAIRESETLDAEHATERSVARDTASVSCEPGAASAASRGQESRRGSETCSGPNE